MKISYIFFFEIQEVFLALVHILHLSDNYNEVSYLWLHGRGT